MQGRDSNLGTILLYFQLCLLAEIFNLKDTSSCPARSRTYPRGRISICMRAWTPARGGYGRANAPPPVYNTMNVSRAPVHVLLPVHTARTRCASRRQGAIDGGEEFVYTHRGVTA